MLIQPAVAEIKDKDGTAVFTSVAAELVDGTYAFAVKIPHNVRGGEYTVHVSPLNNRVFRTTERKIRIMDNQ